MRRRYGLLSSGLVLSALAVVVVAVALRTTVGAVTFDPTFDASVSDSAAGARADVTTEFGLPTGDANFTQQTTFTPPQFTVPEDADVPNGAVVGDVTANVTLGLINGPCNSALPVNVDLMDAIADTSVTVTFDDQFQDADVNGLPDGVDVYPDYLTRIFPGLTPRARYYGQTSIAGSPVSVNFVVFEPGVTLPGLGALDPALGYPAASIINNNGDPGLVPAPWPITDWCTPLSTSVTIFGLSQDNVATAVDESGAIVRANPLTPGSYTFTSRAISQPDADGDDIENQLDTCPYDVNAGSPRIAGDGDQDNDGIDDVCDPNPLETMVDMDDDGYTNRGDNCPLVSNGWDPDNQTDTDFDGIGDACDQNPSTPDGTVLDRTSTAAVQITRPANDDFADALVMPPLVDERVTFAATTEPGEPLPCGSIGATVWYKWVPSASDRWQASTGGYVFEASDFDTVLAVYTGTTLATLNLIGCSDNASYLRSIVAFDAVAGQTYYFQVGGNLGETGFLHLGVSNMCSPMIPGTYNGTVTINGNPAPDGTLVRGVIQSLECATDSTSGGRYVFDCPQSLPVEPPCFHSGWLSFEADGAACTPTVEWGSGLSDVDLQCPAGDTEGDGFSDAREIYLGTDPLDACPDDTSDDAWPLDVNKDALISVVADVMNFRDRIGATPGALNWWHRLDFNGDSLISIVGDVLMYRGRIGETCE
jgi:hypothetical protein